MKRELKKYLLLGGGKACSCTVGHITEYLKEDLKLNLSELPEITVVNHPWDDGDHTGAIVREYGVFGPGDERKNILALSKPWMNHRTYQALIRRNWHPLQVRPSNRTMLLDEPSLGNLIMLSGMLDYGDVDIGKGLLQGIEVFSDICRMPKQFRVLPVSLDQATLTADLADGTSIVGQANIAKHFDYNKRKITSVKLVPPAGMPHPRLYEEVRKAIMEADIIIITSGSWWTSIWPNTLPDGFRDAMSETKAKIIMVMNLVTEKSEAALWDSGHFIEKLFEALGRSFDAVICNDWEADIADWKSKINQEDKQVAELLGKYERGEFSPVRLTRPIPSEFSETGFRKWTKEIITGRFMRWDGKFSHNKNIARTILEL